MAVEVLCNVLCPFFCINGRSYTIQMFDKVYIVHRLYLQEDLVHFIFLYATFNRHLGGRFGVHRCTVGAGLVVFIGFLLLSARLSRSGVQESDLHG